MEKFNINRFGQVFMRLLMVRKKTYTTFFLTTTILFTLATVLSCNPFRLESFTAGEMSSMLVSGTAFCIGLMIAVQGICASFIVSDLKTKQDKIQELMLPATNLEKFVARLLGSTLFVLLIMFIAFALSDVLQQLLNMLIHKGSRASMLVSLFSDLDMFSNLPQDAKSAVWVYLLGAVSSFSVFALGGMLFRKVAWLKTSIAVFLIIVIGLSLFVGFAYVVYTQTPYVVALPRHWPFWANVLGSLAVSVPCLWLSYRLYCRLQAVNNRWINI